MRGRVGRFTWKVLLYLVVAVLVGGLTRDRLLTGLLTAGFVFGDLSVAAVLRAQTAAHGRDRKTRGAGTRPGPGQGSRGIKDDELTP